MRTVTSAPAVAGPGAVVEPPADEITAILRRCPGPGGPARLVVLVGPPTIGHGAVVPAARRLEGARVRWAGPVRDEGEDRGETGGTDGGVADALAGTSSPPGTSRRTRFATWTAGVLGAAPGTEPLVLVVDDADRADPTSLAWLAHLLRAGRRARLLVVLVRRPHAPAGGSSALAELLARHDADRVVLDAATATDGTPASGAATPGGAADPQARFARHRAATATPHARDVARAIAVLDGREPELVAALAQVSGPHFTEAVRRLRWAERVLAPGTDVLRFRTPAIRDGVLAGLSVLELTRWRRDAAKRLCDLGRPVEEAAGQLLATPPSHQPWMQQVVRMAATLRSREGTNADVSRHLEWLRAAARAEERTVVGVESDVELVRAWVHVGAGRTLDHLTEGLDRTDGRTRMAVAVELGLALAAHGRGRDGLDLLRLEHSRWRPRPDAGDRELDAVARSTERFLVAVPFKKVEASLQGDPGPEGARASGATVAGRRALAMDAWTGMVAASAPPEVLATLARRALVVGKAVPMTTLLAGIALECCGAADEAVTAMRATSDPRDGDPGPGLSGPDDVVLASHRALVRLTGADVAGALVDSGRARAVTEQGGWPVPVVLRAAHAAGLLESGSPDRRLLDGEPVPADPWWDHLLRVRMRARCLRVARRDEEARAVLVAAERTAAEVGLVNPVLVPSWVDLALVHVDLADPGAARAVLEAAADRVGRWPVPCATALHGLVEGVLLGGAAGREQVEGAVASLEACGRRLAALEARVRLGELLAADGFDRDARTVLRDAVQTATRAGARAAATRAHDAFVAAGGRMPVPTGDRRDALTATEREVAALAAGGLGNRGIADRLVVSLRTVELHLTHAYRKLAISSRGELARALGERGGAV